MNYSITKVNIELIKIGDTVLHNGHLMTVCKNNLKRGFMGLTLFGDSYKAGHLKVSKVTFNS